MTLHTIMPYGMVFTDEQIQPQTYVQMNGCVMQVNDNGNGNGTIVRLISSDPKLYLRYQVGSEVKIPGIKE